MEGVGNTSTTDERQYWLLRGLLAAAGGSHLVLAIMALSGKGGMRIGGRIYGVTEEISDQTQYALGLTGGYLFSVGGMMTMAMIDPHRYKGVIDFALLIYVLNTYYRLRHQQDAERLFGVTPLRLWTRNIFLNAIGTLILIERVKLERDEIRATTQA